MGVIAPLRAAVIGTGFVGPHHVDAIRRTGYAEVVALAGSDPSRTAARAAALGVARATADVPALLADPAIDVVHVCTPNATHVPIALAALRAGKHVVVEKPIGLDAASAAELLTAEADSGRRAMVAFTYRGYPMIRRARDVVARGELGAIRLAHGQYLQDWLADATAWNWRIDQPVGGASRAVADIGSHWFDTIEFVSGQRVEAVLGDLAILIPTRRRPDSSGPAFTSGAGPSTEVSIASEDAAAILVRFVGGARGSCLVSQISTGHKNDFSIEIAGEHHSLAWRQEDPEHLHVLGPDVATTLSREPSDGVAEPGVPALPGGHIEGWGEALRDLFRPFYAAIVADDPVPGPSTPGAPPTAPYPTLTDGLRALRFVDAVVRSSNESRWVTLDPD